MAAPLGSEATTFTLDNMGRFLCNTLQEARDSADQTVAGRRRDFDVIIIGGGTFGAVMAEHLFVADKTRSRRILVLEGGPFVLPEHVQNLPFQGGAPDMRAPWVNHPSLSYAGLLFAVGGRSLTWGGWSPELLNEELAAYPPSARAELQSRYFKEASKQIGVLATNDFIHGPLHEALRKQLREGLTKAANQPGFSLSQLPDHPAVRYHDGGPATVDEAQLRDLLNLPAKDTTLKAELLELLKLEAPLAVESTTEPGLFPGNKFSAVPALVDAARTAAVDANGVGPVADARKRLMIVPNCHVQELITETQPDNWVRVTGVRVWQKDHSEVVWLAPPRDGRQSAVVVALGTVESTRLALTTFSQSLAGRAAQRMGTNLMAHLRSNLTIRVPREAVAANLPPEAIESLQCSALLVKGKANGHTFHFQITASGLGKLGANSEAELFKKIPTLEHLEAMKRASDDRVVITIRGIGDMTSRNPDSFIDLSPAETDFQRPKAVVHLGNSKADPSVFLGSAETQGDRATWEAMDRASDKIALIFAGDEPFEILPAAGRTIPVPAGTVAQRLAALAAFKVGRRDDLGTTHHDAGTLRMGDDIADSVTNDYGRVHDTTNCYVAGPALFPTVGSPNPMLTGVALGRRTGDLLTTNVLGRPDAVPALEAGFKPLFDGTDATFKKWSLAGPAGGGGMAHLNGEMVSYGDGPLRLLYYALEEFGDFNLRLQFKIFDPAKHNSGVFVRFARPTLDLAIAKADERIAAEPSFEKDNPAWKPVLTGFEVQIDDTAAGDAKKDFYGIRPEPNGLYKNRTGAVYKIQAGDRIWHQGRNEPAVQAYQPGPALVPGVWFEYEIVVAGNDYTVFLTNTATGERVRTTTFHNTDGERGRAPGLVGVQVYPGHTVAWRHIRIKAL